MPDLKQAIITKFALPADADDATIEAAVTNANLLTPAAEDGIRKGVINSFTKEDFYKLPGHNQEVIYGSIKGSALEKKEKEIVERKKLTYKKGTDYNDLNDLIDLIEADARKTVGDQSKLEEDLRKERLAVAQLTQGAQAEYQKGLSEGMTKVIGLARKFAANSLGSKLVDPKQLSTRSGYIDYNYDQLYKPVIEGDMVVSISRLDERPKLDVSGNIMPLDAVYEEIGKTSTDLVFAKIVPNAGRGGEGKAPAGIATSAKTTDVLRAEMKANGINPLSQEGYKYVEEARKNGTN